MKGIIYKIINTKNEKIYIGQTTRSLQERWYGHTNSKKHFDTPLYKAMRKYGKNSFKIEVIEKLNFPKDKLIKKLNEREIFWIKYYDSYNNGYNATRGGMGSTQYDYDEIGDAFRQGLTPLEIMKKFGVSKRQIYGILRQQDCNASAFISITLYNLEGLPLKQFNTIADGARFVIKEGLSESTNVQRVSTQIGEKVDSFSMVYGFYWFTTTIPPITKEEIMKGIAKKKKENPNFRVPIYQIGVRTGRVINVFQGPWEAAKKMKTSLDAISHSVRGNSNTCMGYGWVEVHAVNIKNGYIKDYKPPKGNLRIAIKQLDKETLEVVQIYPNPNVAAKQMNMSSTTISNAAKKGTLTAGFKWEYDD